MKGGVKPTSGVVCALYTRACFVFTDTGSQTLALISLSYMFSSPSSPLHLARGACRRHWKVGNLRWLLRSRQAWNEAGGARRGATPQFLVDEDGRATNKWVYSYPVILLPQCNHTQGERQGGRRGGDEGAGAGAGAGAGVGAGAAISVLVAALPSARGATVHAAVHVGEEGAGGGASVGGNESAGGGVESKDGAGSDHIIHPMDSDGGGGIVGCAECLSSPLCPTCAVCLDNLPPLTAVRDLPCKHLFHVHCLDEWLYDHDSCPACKRVIKQLRPIEQLQQQEPS